MSEQSVFTPGIELKRRESGNILDAHKQWATRPADEAVFDVDELLRRTRETRSTCSEVRNIAWDGLELSAEGGRLALHVDELAEPLYLTNHSLGQLCSLPTSSEEDVDDELGRGQIAPQQFLAKLSADTAARVLNERLQRGVGRRARAQMLVRYTDNTLRGLTTNDYQRVWDHEVAVRVSQLMFQGTWGAAEAFRRAGDQADAFEWAGDKRLPLGWVGDRSMFLCLVDYKGYVEHKGGKFARFLLLSNSEVGAAKLRVTFGLIDYACCNFILWGCTEVYELAIPHVGSIVERWSEFAGSLRQIPEQSTDDIVRGIDAARDRMLGDTQDEVVKAVVATTGLSKTLVTKAYDIAATTPRYGKPRSVWAMVNGLTEISQTVANTADRRVSIDKRAAALMRLV